MTNAPVTGYVMACSDGKGTTSWIASTGAFVGQDIKCRSIHTNNGSSTGPSHSFQAATGSGMWQSGGVHFSTSQVDRVAIDNNGNMSLSNSTNGLTTNLGSSGGGQAHYRLANTNGDVRSSIGLAGTDSVDSGSDFKVWLYNDAGSVSANPITCERETGTIILQTPVFFQDLTNNSRANLVVGSYTPTYTNSTGIAFSNPQVSQYIRVGNNISACGQVTAAFSGTGTIWGGAISCPTGTLVSSIGSISCAYSSGPALEPPVGGYVSGVSAGAALLQFTTPVELSDTNVSYNVTSNTIFTIS